MRGRCTTSKLDWTFRRSELVRIVKPFLSPNFVHYPHDYNALIRTQHLALQLPIANTPRRLICLPEHHSSWPDMLMLFDSRWLGTVALGMIR